MSHVSERFHEGYPGTLMAQVTFEVTCDNTLKIDMKCTASEPTVVNLSNAPFFNLAGHVSKHTFLHEVGLGRVRSGIKFLNPIEREGTFYQMGVVSGGLSAPE